MKKTVLLFLVTAIYSSIFSQSLFFIENSSGDLNSSNYSGGTSSNVLSGYSSIYDLAYDSDNNKIYFTNVINNNIYSSNSDGTSIITILDNANDGVSSPRGIALDGVNSFIYWVEAGSGKIRKAGLDGSTPTDIVTGLVAPVDVSLDLVNNKVYWSDNGLGAKKISRANLDGTSTEDIITGLDQIGGIAIDALAGKIYYVEFGDNDQISRANLDGSSPEVLVSITSGSPRDISVDPNNNLIFWSDVLKSSISKSNRDGSSSSEILTSLSNPIGLSTNWTSALPVELISFFGELVNEEVKLSWETATEVNNYGFDVERENRGSGEWEKIGFVEGHGTTNSPKNYEFTDSELPNVDQVSYRLKQIDNDGMFAYSKIVVVDLTTITSVEDEVVYEFALEQNYPNPFNPTTTIKFTVPSVGTSRDLSLQTKLIVYDILGSEVVTLINQNLQPGNHEVNFNASNLSSGMYFYRLEIGNEYKSIKKMLLLK